MGERGKMDAIGLTQVRQGARGLTAKEWEHEVALRKAGLVTPTLTLSYKSKPACEDRT